MSPAIWWLLVIAITLMVVLLIIITVHTTSSSKESQKSSDGEIYTVKDPEGRSYSIRVLEEDTTISNSFRAGHFWERHFLPHFKEFAEASLRPGDVILDVGANIGSHAVYLANFAPVYAFELQKKVLKVLDWNVANNKNGYKIKICGFGLHDENKTMPMNPVAVNSDGTLNIGGTGLKNEKNGESSFGAGKGEGEMVTVRRFDDFWPEVGKPRVAFIKMDIEGSEATALAGMVEMLRRDEPLVQFEDWALKFPPKIKQARPKDVLEPLGYCIKAIDDHNWLGIPPRLQQRYQCDNK